MKNSFNFFDKIFVINSKDNKERRAYIQDVLKKFEVDFQFFDAIIGNDLTPSEIDAVYDEEEAMKNKTNKRPLSKPEIGCALSHIKIYEHIVEEELESALIFEDDIIPNYEKLHLINDAVSELPKNWDLLHFGTLELNTRFPLSYRLKLFFYFPIIALFSLKELDYTYWQLWNIHPRPYSKTLNKAGYHKGCQSYTISHAGAKKFLNYHDRISAPVDIMISEMIIKNELNAYKTKVCLFEQNKDLESAIEDTRKEMHRLKKDRKTE